MSVLVPVTGAATPSVVVRKQSPAPGKTRIRTVKGPLKSPIRKNLPLPWHE